MDVIAQPSVHREATVSLPHFWVRVKLSILCLSLFISEPPKKIEPSAAEKEVSAHPLKVHWRGHASIPAQPTSEVDATVTQLTAAPPKRPEGTLPLPGLVQAQQPTFQFWGLELTILPECFTSKRVLAHECVTGGALGCNCSLPRGLNWLCTH